MSGGCVTAEGGSLSEVPGDGTVLDVDGRGVAQTISALRPPAAAWMAAVEALRRTSSEARPRRGAPLVVQLGEVRREGHVVELAAVEPPERAGVGPSGVWADGGLDQPARGLSRLADRGLFGVDPGGRIIHVKGKQTGP